MKETLQQQFLEACKETNSLVMSNAAASACAALTLQRIKEAFEAGRDNRDWDKFSYFKYKSFESYLKSIEQ